MQRHAKFLWGLCYRMTGVAADADELVQETYARVLASPPPEDGPLAPWLTRVAMNLARDRLRRRKREHYVGQWLPSPVETEEDTAPPPSARYEQAESMSIAFLLAVEALSPNQRAVLLLRDVFDHSIAETAADLGLSEANVKTTLHRARSRLAAWDARRLPLTREVQRRTGEALGAFLAAVATGDATKLTALLRDDVRETVDGGGQYHSSKVVLSGATRVSLFNRRLVQIRGLPISFEVQELNGLPAMVLTFATTRHQEAPRTVITVSVDDQGRIAEVFSVVADAKLTHVRFPA